MQDFLEKNHKKISQDFPTPLYIYDTRIIDKRIAELEENRPKNLEIFYAMKGNSAIQILQHFRQKNFKTEIASGGELFLAKTAGFTPEEIIYTGPAKTNQELQDSVEYGIETIHVESLHEAERLQKICEDLGKNQKILLRVNANFEVKTYSTQLSGCPSPFGVSEEDLEEILPQILKLDRLEFQGFHVYNASGIMDANKLIQNVENVFNMTKNLEEKFGIFCPVIDFGGGLGVDYTGTGENVNVQDFYQGMQEQIEKFGYQDRKLIMEISRFLVAECGYYITQIMDIKHSRGENFYITDGGIQHFLRAKLFEQNHPVEILSKKSGKILQNFPPDKGDQGGLEIANITGSLCTGLDVLAKSVEVPKAEIGDLVIIKNAGCYALNAGINHFLSHEMPMEILISDDDNYEIIRERGKHEDLLLNQKID